LMRGNVSTAEKQDTAVEFLSIHARSMALRHRARPTAEKDVVPDLPVEARTKLPKSSLPLLVVGHHALQGSPELGSLIEMPKVHHLVGYR
jgi:hypothetical protein